MNLILGTANFNRDGYGKKLEKDECFRILDRAKELGIETVATAFDYGLEITNEYGWIDRIHKPVPNGIFWGDRFGLTVDNFEDIKVPSISRFEEKRILMAPFNPFDYRFKCFSDNEGFIARSILCGGRLQRSHPEDVARLCFGFLKSHDVKNAVFGVESIEELELNVRVANEK